MTVPGWYALVVLGLGVFRVCRLVGWDDITITPRRWVTGIGDDEHSQWAHIVDTAREHGRSAWNLSVGDWFDMGMEQVPPIVGNSLDGPMDVVGDLWFRPPVSERRYYLSKMIRCPWCMGWWVSVAVWVAYEAASRGTLVVMSLFALSALPGLVTKNLDK